MTAVDASTRGRRVVGIDLSMTSTGVAEVFAAGGVITHRLESKPPKRARGAQTKPTVQERSDRLCGIAKDVGHIALGTPMAPNRADLVVLEAPSYGSQGAGTWDRAGLWWLLVSKLTEAGSTPVIVPPKTRALWATGSGAASKSPIAVHVSRMWPDLKPDLSDDEWDALALATMGAQRLGWLPIDLARHREQLARVDWPARKDAA